MSAPSSWTPGGAAVPGPLYSEPRRGHPHIVSALAPPKYPFRGSITRLAHAPSYASPCGSPRTAQGLGFPGVDSSWGRTCSIRRYSLCISLTYLLMPVFPGAYHDRDPVFTEAWTALLETGGVKCVPIRRRVRTATRTRSVS